MPILKTLRQRPPTSTTSARYMFTDNSKRSHGNVALVSLPTGTMVWLGLSTFTFKLWFASEFIALSPTFKFVFYSENRWCSASEHIKLLWEQCLALLLLSLWFGVIYLQFFWGSVHFFIYTNFHPWKLLLNTRLLPLLSEIMSLIVILVGAAPEMFRVPSF